MTSRGGGGRRCTCPRPDAPVPLPDDDDLLSEILLRLPPKPSSLPRASFVCKRWRRLVTEPYFRHRFRARHRNPHLIGFFNDSVGSTFFRSVLDPPDLIPAERFSPPLHDGKGVCDPEHWKIFGCRHGRVLLYNREQKEIVVWDPPTGHHRRVAVPPEFDNQERTISNGAVLCAAAGDPTHVHGGFSSCLFKVAVAGVTSDNTQVFASVYSSETGQWSDLVATAVPFLVHCFSHPGTLVGNTLYWMPLGHGHGIVGFDLDRHCLSVIQLPSVLEVSGNGNSRIIVAEDGGLGLATLSCHGLQMWRRKVFSECVENWVPRKSRKLQKIIGQRSGTAVILGYADDIHVMFLWIDAGIWMLQLDSLQCKKLWETHTICSNHPYATIYDSGI